MGALLDVPKTDKSYESGQGLDIRYGVCSMQGWRIEMEDAHCAKIGLPFGLDKWSFFAVFDGHAGQKASAYCAYNMLDTILQEQYFIEHPRNNQNSSSENQKKEDERQVKKDENDTTEEQIMDTADTDNRDILTESSTEDKDKSKAIVEGEQVKQINIGDQKCDSKTTHLEKTDITNNDDCTKDLHESETGDQLNKSSPLEHLSFEDEKEESYVEKSVFSLEEDDTDGKREKEESDECNRHKSSRKDDDPAEVKAKLDKIKKAIRSGFLNLDVKLKSSVGREDKSGTTAICSLISPTHIFFANCGDSRAVLSYSGRLDFWTEDHKPINPKERERILNAGGTVMIQRVNGSLAVSRALGDFDFKQVSGLGPCEQLVSPEPEIHSIQRSEDDEFLILACDGIWDVMTNKELCDFVRYKLLVEDNIEAICASVIDVCLYRGSRDNMSIIIVVFKGAQLKTPESVAREQEDNDFILNETSASLKRNPSLTIPDLVHILNEAVGSTRQVPMGAAIESKREMLFQITKKFHDKQQYLK